ncbi:uncharacterized protein LOC110837351 isoform X3 [Zootermopsis nevadensis]|uniref:uncharacterized protein LOC110837351 isoform X3 n=1 Tax=Zootermopsis nevadensis TaxID=136037 RepID=UPI000B8E2FAF|nr:uncharacterized protein LOC110837351 isoform X3 [Zootermopsis nevadensis]
MKVHSKRRLRRWIRFGEQFLAKMDALADFKEDLYGLPTLRGFISLQVGVIDAVSLVVSDTSVRISLESGPDFASKKMRASHFGDVHWCFIESLPRKSCCFNLGVGSNDTRRETQRPGHVTGSPVIGAP